jgi:hypothetical protein
MLSRFRCFAFFIAISIYVVPGLLELNTLVNNASVAVDSHRMAHSIGTMNNGTKINGIIFMTVSRTKG